MHIVCVRSYIFINVVFVFDICNHMFPYFNNSHISGQDSPAYWQKQQPIQMIKMIKVMIMMMAMIVSSQEVRSMMVLILRVTVTASLSLMGIQRATDPT